VSDDAIGKALHKAGLTSYPYATAEILRFIRELKAQGHEVVPRPDPDAEWMRQMRPLRPATADCKVRKHADQWVCDTHFRYWSSGICPGAR